MPTLLLTTMAALATVGSASAHSRPPQPPPEASAVDVYRESVPTSRGPRFVGAGNVRSIPLPPGVKLRVRREGREARILERISTSSEFGAPNPLVTIGPGVRAPTHGDGGWAPHGLWAAAKTSFGVGPDQARMLALLFVLVGAAVTVLRVRSRKRDAPDQTG